MTTTKKAWPASDLEQVPTCPACGQIERELAHKGLTDLIFHAADGEWSMYQCLHCRSNFLDPRPTSSSIGRAYTIYYTHESPEITNINKGKFRDLFRGALNDYINCKYNLHRGPTSIIGRWLIPLIAPLKNKADCEIRYLPRQKNAPGRLLDVGCGNGSYLLLAREAGWEVEGIDFDPTAVKTAQKLGLNVHIGGIDSVSNKIENYDAITLSHIIEHVHNPVAFLETCYSLLKKGGQLWLETPNIESLLSTAYGQYWRGLEPPRHLIIFNRESLNSILINIGFCNIRQHYNPGVFYMSNQSEKIKYSSDPKLNKKFEKSQLPKKFAQELIEFMIQGRREFITLTATK